VVDVLGRNSRVFPENDVETADLETLVGDLLDGQYRNPVRIVALNTIECWSQDVSADVAQVLAAVVICSCATCHHPFKISSNGRRAFKLAANTEAGVVSGPTAGD
jgi:hypothetical protein